MRAVRPIPSPQRAGPALTVALAAALVPLLGSTEQASAETVTFTVKNDRGILLSEMEVAKDQRPAPMQDWDWHTTSRASGQVTLEGIAPGDTVWVGRNITTFVEWQIGRPGRVQVNPREPYESIPIAISTPQPEMDLLIPSLPFKPAQPELSQCERSLVGLINDERRRRGLEPLELASTLSAASDGYAGYVETGPPGAGSAHRLLGTPADRAQDMGYPDPHTYGENITWRLTPKESFQSWMDSAGHRQNMLAPNYNAAGIGTRGPAWVLMLGTIEESALRSKAGLHGDTGDASAGEGPDAGCASWPYERQGRDTAVTVRPSLRFTAIGQWGRWSRLRLRAGRFLLGRLARIVIRRERPTCKRRRRGRSGRAGCTWIWRPVVRRRVRWQQLRTTQVLRVRKPRGRLERVRVGVSTKGFRRGARWIRGARAGMLIRLPSAR